MIWNYHFPECTEYAEANEVPQVVFRDICCVSSGTVNARYCCEPRDVSGAKPFMKK